MYTDFSSATLLSVLVLIFLVKSLVFGCFFPHDSDGKESVCNARDLGSVPGSGRSPGGGNGNPLQYSCLENPNGQRSLAGCSPWGCEESDTTEWLTLSLFNLKIVSVLPLPFRFGCLEFLFIAWWIWIGLPKLSWIKAFGFLQSSMMLAVYFSYGLNYVEMQSFYTYFVKEFLL